MAAAQDGLAPLDVDALRAAVAPLRLGRPVIYLPAVDSTNTYATSLARAGARDGTLVITDDQPAGRGRIGRKWRGLSRAQVLLSLVLRPNFPPYYLVMASALAVAESVETAGAAAGIKWPNDVLVDGRKVCGILIETAHDDQGAPFAILGIGLNVNGSLRDDPALAAQATTLADVVGHVVAREVLAAAMLSRLDTLYARLRTGGEAGRGAVWEAWRARLLTLGTQVRIAQHAREVVGIAEAVDTDGALLVRHADGGVTSITWGDVH
jgi:BirA family biotin operon repressor/biotin-[acetyl-CoA-carboxylase] ligase